jgi:glutamyl-tRNA reductase
MLWRSCVLRVGVLGMNFKTAHLGLLEQMSRAMAKLSGERAVFFKYPIVVLTTCNRTEIYFSSIDLAEAQGDILSFFRSQIKEVFEHRLYSYFGIDAFAHLCRVTAGMDSAIFAETEIQRQVKLAYARSTASLILPECIHYIFQKALKIAKEVRTQFALEKGSITLYKALWQIATKILGDLKRQRILLIGYSEINRGIASFFLRKGIDHFFLCTRHPEEVNLEGGTLCGREILNSWSDYDLIICASQSKKYLIEGEGRGGVVFDLSVPRNVDPSLKGVKLMNIEQIHELLASDTDFFLEHQNRRAREAELLIQENALHLASLYRMKMEKKTPRYPLKLRMSGESREGDHISNIFHTSNE